MQATAAYHPSQLLNVPGLKLFADVGVGVRMLCPQRAIALHTTSPHVHIPSSDALWPSSLQWYSLDASMCCMRPSEPFRAGQKGLDCATCLCRENSATELDSTCIIGIQRMRSGQRQHADKALQYGTRARCEGVSGSMQRSLQWQPGDLQ